MTVEKSRVAPPSSSSLSLKFEMAMLRCNHEIDVGRQEQVGQVNNYFKKDTTLRYDHHGDVRSEIGSFKMNWDLLSLERLLLQCDVGADGSVWPCSERKRTNH